CEVGAVYELESHVSGVVRKVLEHDVFVCALSDESVAAHGDRNRVVAGLGRLAHDARGVVIDRAARERIQLLAVDPDVPAREVADVLVEEALVLTGLDVAVGVRVPKGRAVERDQVGMRHYGAYVPADAE